MNSTLKFQKGFQYSEDIRNAVLFGYIYRKEAEKQSERVRAHFCVGEISQILLWLGKLILENIAWETIKSTAKALYLQSTKEGKLLSKMEKSILSDEVELKEFYQDVKEFNEHRMAITEKQFQYIREEIEADVIGKELGKICSQEMREPTIQEIMEANKKAKQKADALLGIHQNKSDALS